MVQSPADGAALYAQAVWLELVALSVPAVLVEQVAMLALVELAASAVCGPEQVSRLAESAAPD